MTSELSPYTVDKVRRLAESIQALALPEVRPDVRHFVHGQVYAREMHIPKGALVIGAVHLADHLCTVLGDVTVFSPDGLTRYEGWHILPSTAGTQRTLLAHEDTWWTTFHHSRGESDPTALERMLTSQDLGAANDFLPLEH